MTAAKDMSRPASQHRLSVGSNAVSVPARNSYSRTHSHAASLGSVNPTHRINRRKSSTFSPATKPAIIGAAVENAVAEGSVALNRRSSTSRAVLAGLNEGATHSSLPQYASVPEEGRSSSSAVFDDGSSLSMQDADRLKIKARRASDGTRLTKKEKAGTGELKCDQCGKAYKHGSCLTKHLWEHTPQWQYTSKLLISKHQQVQLLEAASVLVGMNQELGSNDSDNSSSPAASGSSDMRDDDASSTETTPPPQNDHTHRDSKRYSNNSSLFSRSYQSVFSIGSAPNQDGIFGHNRHWSNSSTGRPLTANASVAESYGRDQDPQDLAAAVGLLSCSYGTPKHGPSAMPMDDIPPVPALPAKYQNYRHQNDVEMEEDGDSEEETNTRNDDMEDHGMFGKMDA